VTNTTTPHQRLLDAAGGLFYTQGIGAVGVDTICAAAGVSKRTLYQHFGSKDQLVAESLAAFGPAILSRYLPAADTADDDAVTAGVKITEVFRALSHWAASKEFRGCAFVNVATELADVDHPARAVARDYKLRLRQFFLDQATAGAADDPVCLADQLLMLFDGAITAALMRTVTGTRALTGAVATLLDAHRVN
jgi:AcrR family transcriptional regulator